MTDNEMEVAIASKIVTDAIALGYAVSVSDGEEWTVKRSSNHDEIMAALQSTGIDHLKFRTAKGDCIGVVALIWGNSGWELVNDYTYSPAMETIMQGANDLADSFQEQYA